MSINNIKCGCCQEIATEKHIGDGEELNFCRDCYEVVILDKPITVSVLSPEILSTFFDGEIK